MIGGGQAGLEAAIAAAEGGESVVVIDEGYDVGGALLADRDGIGAAAELRRARVEAGVELLAPAIAIGLFEQGLVPSPTATSCSSTAPTASSSRAGSSSSRSSSPATTSSA